MRCQDLMTRPVRFCHVHDTVQTVARKMHEFNIGFLPICGEGTRVAGILTDRDIALRVVGLGLDPGATLAGDVMTRTVLAVRADEEIRRAEELMARHRKSRILVVDGEARPLGVISLADLANRGDAEALDTIRKVAAREIVVI